MKPNRLTQLLGIEHPILQGGMTWISDHVLAAAVSEAGALGVIGAGGMDAEELRAEIIAARGLTTRPFAVNIPLVNVRPDRDDDIVEQLIETVLEERVAVVVTGGGSPARFTSLLQRAGVRVLHVVPSVRLALKAEAAGVDAVIAESIEAGGHVAVGGLSTFALVPQVVDAVSLPVVAAGGIADARGIAASLVLGASAAQLGTRFITATECNAHRVFKQALLSAGEDATAIYCREHHAGRALMTPAVRRMLDMEKAGDAIAKILAFRGRRRAHDGCLEGDVEGGILPAGAATGLLNQILPASEIVDELVRGCEKLLGQHEGTGSTFVKG